MLLLTEFSAESVKCEVGRLLHEKLTSERATDFTKQIAFQGLRKCSLYIWRDVYKIYLKEVLGYSTTYVYNDTILDKNLITMYRYR